MKLILKSIVFILTLSGVSQAQPKLKGDEHIGLRGSYIQFMDNYNLNSYGATLHWNVSNRLVLNYHLQFGTDSKGNFHLHSYPGGAGAVLLAASAFIGKRKYRELKLVGALISLAIPEGVGYTAKLGNNVYLIPYINPAGFHLAGNEYFSGEVGTRVRFRIGKINIMPYASGEVLYTMPLPIGLGTGLAITYQI